MNLILFIFEVLFQLLGAENTEYMTKSSFWCSELAGGKQCVSWIDVESMCVYACAHTHMHMWTHAVLRKKKETWSGFSHQYPYNCMKEFTGEDLLLSFKSHY